MRPNLGQGNNLLELMVEWILSITCRSLLSITKPTHEHSLETSSSKKKERFESSSLSMIQRFTAGLNIV